MVIVRYHDRSVACRHTNTHKNTQFQTDKHTLKNALPVWTGSLVDNSAVLHAQKDKFQVRQYFILVLNILKHVCQALT